MKNAMINARIESKLKKQAETILHRVGLSGAEAIRLFYSQICLQKGLPFEVKIPNKETIKAMRDADTRKTHEAESVDELFDETD
ncbi:MAG: type II toxin-antitoxin system RelB/DinJ family antitoxin [Gammaproteobacteria bacterium]|nr:type II toxin-antitoxin system RelB/DinJ family antitoxin [Gammaproteobacteria bacterium]